jgi:hypothetical protein
VPYVGLLDESNATPGEFVRFYVAAVLGCPIDNLSRLSLEVAEIRRQHGYRPGDFFKWEAHSRPKHIDASNHRIAKQQTLNLLEKHRLVFLPVLVHHHVAENKPAETLVEWTANMAIRLWDRYLEDHDDSGVCILDRRPAGDEASYLRGVFSRTPDSPPGKDFSLKRTFLLGYTMEGASHLLSVLDITLGAFCYAINERRQERTKIASTLLKKVVRAMWTAKTYDETSTLVSNGYAFLPMTRRSVRVQADFDELTAHWNHLLAL